MSKKYTKEIKIKAVKRYQEFGEAGLNERRGTSKTVKKGRSRKNGMSLEEENLRLKAEIDYLKKLMQIER